MSNLFPQLSLAERDRRWKNIRKFMFQENLDCLIVFGLGGHAEFDRYLTNDRPGSVVIFPREDEPVNLTWTTSRITAHLESSLRGEITWVNDIRVGVGGSRIAGIVHEKSLDRGNIGIVGLATSEGGSPEGYVPYNTWNAILQSLPDVHFFEVSDKFPEIMLVKSDEELALLERAAEIGELACKTMMQATKIGVLESEIFSEVVKSIYSNCAHGNVTSVPIIFQSGPDNPGWGPPAWLARGQKPRVIMAGDMVQSEIFANYGGLEVQEQMSIAVKPMNEKNQKCGRVAEKAYEVGLKALGESRTFREVAEAMEAVVANEGCWHLTPLIHTLNPHELWSSGVAVGIERLPGIDRYKQIGSAQLRGKELVIKPRMVFALQGNACLGRNFVNVGGSVLLTETGTKELNHLPNKVNLIE